MKAIHSPSGDHAGLNSCTGAKFSGVARRGVPAGRSATQTRPMAWKATVEPSGEAVCQRRNSASKGPSSMRNRSRARSEMVRCTRASNGTGRASPDATSTSPMLPPAEITMVPPSEDHEYPGRTRRLLSPLSTAMLIGSTSLRSAPVSRSNSQSAVRGPKRWPLNDTVAAGRWRAKASQRPSGEDSGANAPPLERRPAPVPNEVPLVMSRMCPLRMSIRRI